MITSKKSNITVHFPTKREMKNQIWNREYHRKPPKNNQSQKINYIYLLDLLNFYNLKANFIFGKSSPDTIMDATNILLPILINKVLKSPPPKSLLNNIYDYLAEQDKLEKSDAIFVHGSPDIFPRAKAGVDLFKKELAEKLIFSGGYPSTDRIILEKPEAEMYFDYAVTKGVNPKSLVIEKTSITLAGNVQNTLRLFDKIKWHPKSIIIVTGNFCLRRAYGHWLKHTTGEKIVRYAAVPKSARKSCWYKNEGGATAFLSEYFKLRLSQELGDL